MSSRTYLTAAESIEGTVAHSERDLSPFVNIGMLRMQELFLFYGWLMFSSTKTEKEAQHSFQKNENMALLLYLTYGRKTQPANSSEINSNRYLWSIVSVV